MSDSIWPHCAVRHERMSVEEFCMLRLRHMAGSIDAKKEIFIQYARFVYKIARGFDTNSLSVDDLCQEGVVGLFRAVDRFDETRGVSFQTVAGWWIRAAITRAIDQKENLIRISTGQSQRINRMRRIQGSHHRMYGTEIGLEDLAFLLGLSKTQVETALANDTRTVSLDDPIGHDSDHHNRTIADLLASPPEEDPEALRAAAVRAKALRNALFVLNDRERMVVEMRCGLNNYAPETLEVIGQRFGVTRERIRQIEALAYRKLRDRLEDHRHP